MAESKHIGISLEQKLLEQFDYFIKRRGYANRSQAIRELVRRELVTLEWERGRGEVVATVTLLLDHEAVGATHRLGHLQHEQYRNVVSTQHVHLDRDNCLEVLVLRGKAREIRALANRLVSAKGVKHGAITMTSTGRRLP